MEKIYREYWKFTIKFGRSNCTQISLFIILDILNKKRKMLNFKYFYSNIFFFLLLFVVMNFLKCPNSCIHDKNAVKVHIL